MSSEIEQRSGDDRRERSPGAPAAAPETLNGESIRKPIEESSAPGVPPCGNEVGNEIPVVSARKDSVRGRVTGDSTRRDIEEGPDEEENEALEEIDNVLWIKNVPITKRNRCKEALRSWAQKDRLFTSRIDRKRKQSSDFQNEVYQLVGFYSVFQGVLLTAVAQSNLLHCNNTWTATLLSSLASFVTIIGVILKLRSIIELENTIASEETTRRALVAWQLSLREEGENFNFDCVKAKNQQTDPKKKRREKRPARWLKGSFVAVVVTLTLFSVGFVVSIRQILCNPGRMTLTTTFVNKTTLSFKLKEGDNGVYKELCTLRGLPDENAQPSDESKITLEFDSRSTYKEYRVVTSSRPASAGRVSTPVKILICSNFIIDNSTIYIVPNPTPNADNPHNYVIQGDLRRVSKFWPVSKLLRLFKTK